MNDESQSSRKPPRKLHTILTKDTTNLQALVEKYGGPKAGEMLGLTNINEMLRKGEARPAYEIAAGALLNNTVKERRILAVQVTEGESLEMLKVFLRGMNVRYTEWRF